MVQKKRHEVKSKRMEALRQQNAAATCSAELAASRAKRFVEIASISLPSWYCIRTDPLQESRCSRLLAHCYETLFPQYRGRYRYYGQWRESTLPLFPTYLFARFKAAESLANVRSTKGVSSVLSWGNAPIPVQEVVIEQLRARIGADGLVELYEPLTSGQRVEITAGLAAGLEGVFVQDLPAERRVIILLAMLGRDIAVPIDREDVRVIQ